MSQPLRRSCGYCPPPPTSLEAERKRIKRERRGRVSVCGSGLIIQPRKQSWEPRSRQQAVVCNGLGDPFPMKGSGGLAALPQEPKPGATRGWRTPHCYCHCPGLWLTPRHPSPHCQAEASTYAAGWHFRGFYGSWDLCTNGKHMRRQLRPAHQERPCLGKLRHGRAGTTPALCWSQQPELTGPGPLRCP